MNARSAIASGTRHGARSHGWSGCGAIAIAVFVFGLATLAPGCLVHPVVTHDAAADGSTSSPAKVPGEDPSCCDELRAASVPLGALASPGSARAEWSPLAALPAASARLSSARAYPRAPPVGGAPAVSPSVPIYLRTLRLRV